MLEDILEQVRETCDGLLEEDILVQLEQCSNIAPEDAPRLARYFASLNA